MGFSNKLMITRLQNYVFKNVFKSSRTIMDMIMEMVFLKNGHTRIYNYPYVVSICIRIHTEKNISWAWAYLFTVENVLLSKSYRYLHIFRGLCMIDAELTL